MLTLLITLFVMALDNNNYPGCCIYTVSNEENNVSLLFAYHHSLSLYSLLVLVATIVFGGVRRCNVDMLSSSFINFSFGVSVSNAAATRRRLHCLP